MVFPLSSCPLLWDCQKSRWTLHITLRLKNTNLEKHGENDQFYWTDLNAWFSSSDKVMIHFKDCCHSFCIKNNVISSHQDLQKKFFSPIICQQAVTNFCLELTEGILRAVIFISFKSTCSTQVYGYEHNWNIIFYCNLSWHRTICSLDLSSYWLSEHWKSGLGFYISQRFLTVDHYHGVLNAFHIKSVVIV